MKQFAGFPARTEFVPVPAAFFSQVMPEIDDVDELKVTLHLFRLLYPRKGYPRFVTLTELENDIGLKASLKVGDKMAKPSLETILSKTIERGAFLSLKVNQEAGVETIYLLNTAADREALSKIGSGEIKLAGLDVKNKTHEAADSAPNIYALYESNIGMLTPMVAEELKDAEKNYPLVWIEDAIKEAVNANKRNWRYIARILERWSTEGKKDGTYQRDTKKTDPDKYVKDKYWQLFQH